MRLRAEAFYGKEIIAVTHHDGDEQHIDVQFAEGTLRIKDAGHSCCERRYITCDDDLQSIVGSRLIGIELKEGPKTEDEYVVYETAFVDILTSEGFVQLTTHNDHNGYYGGFDLHLSVVA